VKEEVGGEDVGDTNRSPYDGGVDCGKKLRFDCWFAESIRSYRGNEGGECQSLSWYMLKELEDADSEDEEDKCRDYCRWHYIETLRRHGEGVGKG